MQKNMLGRPVVTPIDIKCYSDAIVALFRENPLEAAFAHQFYDWIDEGEEKIISLIQSPPAFKDVAEMAIRDRAAKLKRALLAAENVVIDYRLAGEASGSYLIMKRPEDPRTSAFEDCYKPV